ncbi:hypothetical protein [Xanthovirga aplysinae]|uniref:hypothetical protein n=1 Tax=Xanthovirga aplysinae TaxID=2529853 RepID=UPI0012BBEA10|nr:hypothetical protein [Xanthovirga aplysinae]MTI33256.1 hypothetical protein [Xanthovirga aplysinae]
MSVSTRAKGGSFPKGDSFAFVLASSWPGSSFFHCQKVSKKARAKNASSLKPPHTPLLAQANLWED